MNQPISRPAAPAARAPPTAKLPSSPPIKASGKFGGDDLEESAAPPVKAPPARFARPVSYRVLSDTQLKP